jgi:hypothetical protein
MYIYMYIYIYYKLYIYIYINYMYTYIMICKERQKIGKCYKLAPMVFHHVEHHGNHSILGLKTVDFQWIPMVD